MRFEISLHYLRSFWHPRLRTVNKIATCGSFECKTADALPLELTSIALKEANAEALLVLK
jgi:hypothetical protein